MLLICSVRYQIDPALLNNAVGVFTTSASFQNPIPPVFAPDFGVQKMKRDMQIVAREDARGRATWRMGTVHLERAFYQDLGRR